MNSDFTALTEGELVELQSRAYSWAMRLYNAVNELVDKMAATPATYSAEYQALKDRERAAMSAAREQNDLYFELRDELRARAAARKENASA